MTRAIMKIIVNDKEQTFDKEMLMFQLIEMLGIDIRTVAVAVNGEVVPQLSFRDVTVKDGDVIEFVRMVGGGA